MAAIYCPHRFRTVSHMTGLLRMYHYYQAGLIKGRFISHRRRWYETPAMLDVAAPNLTSNTLLVLQRVDFFQIEETGSSSRIRN